MNASARGLLRAYILGVLIVVGCAIGGAVGDYHSPAARALGAMSADIIRQIGDTER